MNKTIIKAALGGIVALLGAVGVYTGFIDMETFNALLEALD